MDYEEYLRQAAKGISVFPGSSNTSDDLVISLTTKKLKPFSRASIAFLPHVHAQGQNHVASDRDLAVTDAGIAHGHVEGAAAAETGKVAKVHIVGDPLHRHGPVSQLFILDTNFSQL
ncbi:hypothetical protein Ciccas_013070 [Cichlidogyrus casuarinus]|uniref:Uncharacterized protein n=1 Tax=Cichlidogyrus casuarinus TaxID=1844966 RepID=A0ABD2PLK5_9PLAT